MLRAEGVLSEKINRSRIAFVGCGASSYLIEKIARLNPEEILLIDGDTVEEANIERTSYFPHQVGEKKVKALKSNILRINPNLKIKTADEFLTEKNVELLERSNIVVCGVDSFEAKLLINRFCYPKRIPAVYVSFHRKIEGGRIIWTDTENSPCYECIDYVNCLRYQKGENLNLKSEPGCIADAQFIDAIAFKVTLAIIDRGESSSYGHFYEKIKGKNEIIVQSLPDYEFGNLLFDAILSDVDSGEREEIREILGINFIAYLKCNRKANCKICG